LRAASAVATALVSSAAVAFSVFKVASRVLQSSESFPVVAHLAVLIFASVALTAAADALASFYAVARAYLSSASVGLAVALALVLASAFFFLSSSAFFFLSSSAFFLSAAFLSLAAHFLVYFES
jgi:hypothetical protein